MDEYQSLNHTQWECLYHVIFIPKCRRRTLYVGLRQYLGETFRRLAEQRESCVEEGHLMPDHVHMLLRIPPKYLVSQVIGYMKGKSAIHLARVCGEKKRNFVCQHFGARDAISFRPWAEAKMWFGHTSRIRKKRTGGWTNCSCYEECRLQAESITVAALAVTISRFERLTQIKPPALPEDTHEAKTLCILLRQFS